MADDFFLPAHREVFEAMMAIDQRRQPIDIISLADELKTRGVAAPPGGRRELPGGRWPTRVPTAENIEHYVRLVKEKATLRRLIAACAEVQSRAYGEFGNYEEFLDEAENAVFKVAQQTRKDSYSTVGEMMGEVLESIEERARERKEITGVPTGFTKFDHMTAGLQPENLIIVAARPGVGKTSWAVNVAMNAALLHKMPVLIFSLEMSKYELMERMLAGEARIDSARLKRGQIEYSDWKNRIYPAGNRLAQAPILIDDSGAPSILDIRAKARRFRSDMPLFPARADEKGGQATPLGLIVVDYLQLARGGTGRQRRLARAGDRRHLPGAQDAGQGSEDADHRGLAAEPRPGEAGGQAPAAVRPARIGRHRAGRRHDRLHPPGRDVQPRLGREGAKPS